VHLAGVEGLADGPDWSGVMAAIAQQRDREAFARLFDHFTPRLESYLQKLGADAVSAEEIAQDAMLTVWRKADLFDPQKSSLATWIYRIARNRRIDLGRRDRMTYLDPQEDMFTSVVDETVGQDMLLEGAEREDLVREAMKELPEEQVSLLRLAFYQGRSHSQIAEDTGLPLGTVKSRIRLAFTRLRRTLERNGVVSAG
jgi:RNA polymerase sigma factor (sigma-70 family)